MGDLKPGVTSLYFSNLILRGKFRKVIWFICEQETGGFLITNYQATDQMGVMDKTVPEILAQRESTQEKTPLFYVGGVWGNSYFYSIVYYGGCGQVGCAETCRGSRPGGTYPEAL